MNPEWQAQADQLAKNMMLLAQREQERIKRELRQIDRATPLTSAAPRKIALAPLTLHDKAVSNPILRKMLRDLQKAML